MLVTNLPMDLSQFHQLYTILYLQKATIIHLADVIHLLPLRSWEYVGIIDLFNTTYKSFWDLNKLVDNYQNCIKFKNYLWQDPIHGVFDKGMAQYNTRKL